MSERRDLWTHDDDPQTSSPKAFLGALSGLLKLLDQPHRGWRGLGKHAFARRTPPSDGTIAIMT